MHSRWCCPHSCRAALLWYLRSGATFICRLQTEILRIPYIVSHSLQIGRDPLRVHGTGCIGFGGGKNQRAAQRPLAADVMMRHPDRDHANKIVCTRYAAAALWQLFIWRSGCKQSCVWTILWTARILQRLKEIRKVQPTLRSTIYSVGISIIIYYSRRARLYDSPHAVPYVPGPIIRI